MQGLQRFTRSPSPRTLADLRSDEQLVLGRCPARQVGRPPAPEDAIDGVVQSPCEDRGLVFLAVVHRKLDEEWPHASRARASLRLVPQVEPPRICPGPWYAITGRRKSKSRETISSGLQLSSIRSAFTSMKLRPRGRTSRRCRRFGLTRGGRHQFVRSWASAWWI
jgi:hypothetical protein